MIDLAHFKKKLTTRAKELGARLDEVEDLLDNPHTKDFSDQAIEREQDEVLEGLGQSAARELHLIREALARIKNGSYGVCLACGGDISQARLEAVPFASLCKDCASKAAS